jgi:hypothetical protein
MAKRAGDSVAIAPTTEFSDKAHNGPAANYDVSQTMKLAHLSASQTTEFTLSDITGLRPGDADTDIKQ